MKRAVSGIIGMFVFFASFCCILSDSFADPIVIKYAHQLPESQPVAKQARFFEKLVTERAKGRVKIQIYPAGQLFGAKELFNAVRTGEVEMAAVVIGPMQGAIPLLEIFDIPFLFEDFDAVKAAWYGRVRDLTAPRLNRLGAKWLAPGYYGFTQVSNSKLEIKSPKDFEGLKIRAVGPMTSDIIKQFGGSSITMGGGEAYMAMARGTVDGSATGVVSMYTRKYSEVQKYATIMNLNYIGIPILINLEFWNSLPKDIQQIIQESAEKSAEFVKTKTEVMEAECLKGIERQGMDVYILTPQEREAFKDAARPVTERWIKRHGEIGKSLVEYVGTL